MLLTANVSVAALLTGIELGVIAALTSARLPVFEVAVFDVVPPDADAEPEKLNVAPAEPVTVYVQLKLVLAPAASEASEAGVGPLASVSVALPPVVSDDGVMVLSALPPLFVTDIVTVTCWPVVTEDGDTLSVAVSAPTCTVLEVMLGVLTVPFVAVSVNDSVPVDLAWYVHVKVWAAPLARLADAGLGPVSLVAVAPFTVGFAGATLFCVPVARLVTAMESVTAPLTPVVAGVAVIVAPSPRRVHDGNVPVCTKL